MLSNNEGALREAAFPLSGGRGDYDVLLDAIGESRTVLLGEATHGSHEFYRERALITRRLIEEKGFSAVAVEGDWPDAAEVNAYVTARKYGTAADSLAGFRRFPTWMWRNAEVVDFLGWLRVYNDEQPAEAARVGFYGLDLYSLYASIDAVLSALGRVDPAAAARARTRYACFDHYGRDTRRYGYATSLGIAESCEREVTQELLELVDRRLESLPRHHATATEEDYFHAEQNARLIKNAEEYYRSMFGSSVSTWNLRDRHMHEMLEALRAFLARRLEPPKIVVWAHNSHVGDARATAMGEAGEWTLGQLAREHASESTFLVGFSTYEGSVTAARDWDAPAERRRVRPALPESHEALLHALGRDSFLLLSSDERVRAVLGAERLTRAIGVVYRPDRERSSHYLEARLSDAYDALIHVDRTSAVEPLETSSRWHSGEAAETYPFAV